MAKAAGTSLSRSQKIAWLRLIRTDNVGPVTFRQLLNRTGSAEAAIAALPSLAGRIGVGARVPSNAEAEDEIAALEKLGGRFVASGEADYPALLRYISASPPLLAIIGGERLDLERTVGIVGARNASAAGQRMTNVLAADLGARGYTIVSGLARGIDAAAHKASLGTGTIAVLAGGLDHIYPEENIPRARDFPRRNRLVSGLSLGIVVVEAAKRSGSLITARLALEQNRDVFAVPGSPLDPRAEGGNHLIQQGAKLVTSAEDIIETLASADPARTMLLEPDWEPEPGEAPIDLEPSSDDRARLLDVLSRTPTQVDALIAATGFSVSVVQTLLLELDLGGRLEWSSGRLVALRP